MHNVQMYTFKNAGTTKLKYTLITKAGKIMVFYILDTAMTYKTIYGGVIVTNDTDVTLMENVNEQV